MSDEEMEKFELAPALTHLLALEVYESTREIFITAEIGEEFGGWFAMVMRRLEGQSTEPIKIWINTPGGDVTGMFLFHDLVRASPCKIITIGLGQVCSAGVLMLACGNYRLVTESCILMSHRAQEGIVGTLEDIEAQAAVVNWSERHWAELMSRYTSTDKREWFLRGKKTSQWWKKGAEDIIAEGLADDVFSHDKL